MLLVYDFDAFILFIFCFRDCVACLEKNTKCEITKNLKSKQNK